MHAHDSALTVHKPIRVGLIRNPLDGGVLISKDDNWSSLLVGTKVDKNVGSSCLPKRKIKIDAPDTIVPSILVAANIRSKIIVRWVWGLKI